MLLRQLFDRESSTYTYLIADRESGKAALIDPVVEQVDRDLTLLEELGLELVYALDTHVHADHITGSGELRNRTGAQVVASRRGAACADIRVQGGDGLRLGNLEIAVLETPGHTDDSVSYKVGSNVFTGDALLVRKTGRTDFQNGDPEQLYRSLTEVLLAQPEDTKLWPGHDYAGHTVTTVAEERRFNKRLAGRSREEFVKVMSSLGLPRPKFIDQAVPANLRCGTPESAQPSA